jgi:PAS domain S-box-containing protein
MGKKKQKSSSSENYQPSETKVAHSNKPRQQNPACFIHPLITTDHYERQCFILENQHPCIFEFTGIAMVILDEDTTIVSMNKECEKLIGYTKEEAEGKKSWTEFVVNEELEKLTEYHRRRRIDPTRIPQTYETRIIDKFKNVRDVSVNATMIPNTKKSIASLLDITEKNTIMRALKKSEQTFRALVEQLPNTVIYIAALDESSTTLYVSPQIANLLGFTQEEYAKNPEIWYECLHPDDKARIMDQIARYHKTGEQFCAEYKMCRKDKQIIWFSDHAEIINDEKGNPIFLLGVNTDITERKEHELKLKEKEIELVSQNQKLEEMNTALEVLLRKGEKDKKELEDKVLINIKQLIMPYVMELKKIVTHAQQKTVVEIIESNLGDIISSFAYTLSQLNLNLTPKEIMIANLIKQGKTTKEICDLLRSSEKAVSFHRGNIRKKLGLMNKKISLKSFLIAKA